MQGHIRKRTHTTKTGRKTINWYVVVDNGRDETGKRRQKWHGSFRTRKEAEVARARIVGDLHAGTYTEPTRITLTEWVAERWLPTVQTQVKPSTYESYARNMRHHVLPVLGQRLIHDIGPGQLNALYAQSLHSGRRDSNGGLSPKTVRYIHTIIHKALSDALDAGLIPTNVAERAKPPKPRARASSEIRFWKAHELKHFLDQTREHRLRAAWQLAAMTGMRRGEVLGLRWKDLDHSNQRLQVRQALVSVAYEVIVSTPKNHRARVIDLDEGTFVELRKHRDRQCAERTEWGTDYFDNDLVFCKENGEPLHPQTFTQAFDRLVHKMDLPRIRLHDLRHTHATIALSAGISPKVISERLGHENPAFTLKQYAHVIPGMQADAARQIAQVVLQGDSRPAATCAGFPAGCSPDLGANARVL